MQPSPEALKLFELMKDCARACNLRIAIQSLNFWVDLHETLTDSGIEDLGNYPHIFE